MALEKKDFEQIASYIKVHLGEWLSDKSLVQPPVVYEVELRERIVRVEEELKHQRELMKQGFELMERRFELIDKHFEQMDKRFEQMDKRFEALTKRMDRFMIWSFGIAVTCTALVISAIKLW